jgi:hypothetical protein
MHNASLGIGLPSSTTSLAAWIRDRERVARSRILYLKL